MREFGLIVDSVATKHYSAPNVPGTQTLYVSDIVKVPMVDRGGLMALVLHPVEDGDADKYEIFDVTSDQPWTPCHYMHNVQAYQVSTPSVTTSIIQDIPFVSTKTHYYDPGDKDLPSYGITAKLQLDTDATLHKDVDPFLEMLSYNQFTGYGEYTDDAIGHSMDKVPKVSRNSNTYAFATKAWHHVMRNELDPAMLQPCFGFCPVNIIKATLKQTTQLARMVIRYPMKGTLNQ